MGRHRSRSRSYSPRRRSRTPPPRGRKRYDDDRYGDTRSRRDRRSPLPSGLLVRNLPLDARPEDLRGPFERYGPVKDVYLPRNYYTGEPRGFGFVKYRHGEDAAEAKQQLNHSIIGGREIRIVFAEENRKTPQEMRVTSHGSSRNGGGSRRRARSRSPRRRYRSYSRSPSPAREDSRDDRGRDDDYSPKRSRSYSRSVSPGGTKDDRRSPRAKDDRRSPRAKDDRRSPRAKENGHSPNDKKDRAPSRSPSPRGNDRSPSRSRSRSYSPR
ncbi:Serine/arginine-rich SC35-like splicing factor scl28, variant 2 [Trifolium repens]|nr:Serine/arginine-rich SC35-like splicing factor scl28, variant 2 [Trifolium repens]